MKTVQIILFTVLFLFIAGARGICQVEPPWGQFGRDMHHSCRSPYQGHAGTIESTSAID